jgi:hypothetical protein
MQIASFGQRNYLIRPASQFFGFCIRRSNTIMFEQRRHHIAKHGILVAARPV